MVVTGGAALYGAEVMHGDCSDPDESAQVRACVWVDILFTFPLCALEAQSGKAEVQRLADRVSVSGVRPRSSLALGGVGLGVYSLVRDR
jgi:hypothetical protein